MKLAAKLIAFVVVGFVCVLALNAYLSVRRDVALFQTDMIRNGNQLGRTLKDLVEDVWRTGGEDRALQLIRDANEEEPSVSVRWVWLTEVTDDLHRPRASLKRIRDLLSRGEKSFEERDENGRGFFYTYVPLSANVAQPGALELARSLDGLDHFRRNTVIRACGLAVGLIVASGFAVWGLGLTLIGRPLDELIEKTRRVSEGDLSKPLQLRAHDELRQLGDALNRMCEHLAEAREKLDAETEARISALEQLRHADRLATVGRIASGVAHELGTPMNVVSARASLILESTSSDDVRENARIVKTQIEKMTRIIRQLLDFARQHHPHKELRNLKRLVVQSTDLLMAMANKQGVQFEVSVRDDANVNVDADQLQQVLTNLIVNAIHAMPQGGRVAINACSAQAKPPEGCDGEQGTYTRIDVRDSGIGIPASDLSRIFDPFYTTKDIGQGTGLGLSIAYGMIREHGGWINVASQPGEGSCFSIFLPISEKVKQP